MKKVSSLAVHERRRPPKGALLVSLWVSAVGLAGCEEPVQVSNQPGLQWGAPGGGNAAGTPSPTSEADAGKKDKFVAPEFDDDAFVESDANRDPFRSFLSLFSRRAIEAPQRLVIMPTTAVEDMRLIAIISGSDAPRAMLVDTNGVGHVVRRGDFVGRAEVVQAGGAESAALSLNWRLERIRPQEIVLTREDPTGPDRPPLTRVVALHPEGD